MGQNKQKNECSMADGYAVSSLPESQARDSFWIVAMMYKTGSESGV